MKEQEGSTNIFNTKQWSHTRKRKEIKTYLKIQHDENARVLVNVYEVNIQDTIAIHILHKQQQGHFSMFS